MDELMWMEGACPDDDHRFTRFPGYAHWPGERFMVTQALKLSIEAGNESPTRAELLCVLAHITGQLEFAETMLDNAINFGTVKETHDGYIVVGDSVPLRLLRNPSPSAAL